MGKIRLALREGTFQEERSERVGMLRMTTVDYKMNAQGRASHINKAISTKILNK